MTTALSRVAKNGDDAEEKILYRTLVAQKEKELHEVTEARVHRLEKELERYREEIAESERRFERLRQDFQFNLKLIDERDSELERYDSAFANIREVSFMLFFGGGVVPVAHCSYPVRSSVRDRYRCDAPVLYQKLTLRTYTWPYFRSFYDVVTPTFGRGIILLNSFGRRSMR